MIRCVSALILLTACGGAETRRTARDADLQALGDSQAIQIIQETLQENGLAMGTGWEVDVGTSVIPVDVRIGTTTYGIEWVSPQDRANHDDVFPPPDPNGQLRLMGGEIDGTEAQVLVLEQRMYRYDPDLDRVAAGATGAAEVEGRLRRDVLDFVEYLRGQGAI